MKNLLKTVKSPAEVKKTKRAEGKAKTIPDDPTELETSLITAIDGLLVEDNGKKWKQSGTFAPSSTSNCARYHVYRFRGYEQRSYYSAQTKRIFEMGNKVEDMVEDLFNKLGILLDSQVEIKLTDPPVKGFVDFIIDWGGPRIVECKSINEAGFMYRKMSRKPTDSHYAQVQWYMKALDHQEAYVFYYNKNTSEILPILVKRDEKWLAKMTKKYGIIYDAYEKGILPERPYKLGSPTCEKCDAKDYCWADSEVGVKIT